MWLADNFRFEIDNGPIKKNHFSNFVYPFRSNVRQLTCSFYSEENKNGPKAKINGIPHTGLAQLPLNGIPQIMPISADQVCHDAAGLICSFKKLYENYISIL